MSQPRHSSDSPHIFRNKDWDTEIIRYVPEGKRLATVKRVYIPRTPSSRGTLSPTTPTSAQRPEPSRCSTEPSNTLKNGRRLLSRLDRYIASTKRPVSVPEPSYDSPSRLSEQNVDRFRSFREECEGIEEREEEDRVDLWRATVLDIDRVPPLESRRPSNIKRSNTTSDSRITDASTNQDGGSAPSDLRLRRVPARRQVSFARGVEELGPRRPSGVKNSGAMTLLKDDNKDILYRKNTQVLYRRRLERASMTSSSKFNY